ncbi:PTS transporter subunit EIIB [Pseudomonas sp. 7P_10.2_Bac1]|uniref:PTS transporter subunit EIIB n=1 Tax=Pseudomonas sp. 7P_10.2_Bac1 TaxID=2971614 RepID=UPI0021C9AC47|nr:PTS transporter subunit EIIB [Pseudomonas sp. 7P_10.2_Bac1]MCU1726213.1 PTS transporter subunit EIIB [Pseudomonas sp. 7P_10.2_Bac1]
MFAKLQQAFWKALTPDLVPDAPAQEVSTLDAAVIAALGGAANLKSEQRVALTRIRVELNDASRIQPQALRQAGVPGLMTLAGGVVHLVGV